MSKHPSDDAYVRWSKESGGSKDPVAAFRAGWDHGFVRGYTTHELDMEREFESFRKSELPEVVESDSWLVGDEFDYRIYRAGEWTFEWPLDDGVTQDDLRDDVLAHLAWYRWVKEQDDRG